jgi:hypothetical protein
VAESAVARRVLRALSDAAADGLRPPLSIFLPTLSRKIRSVSATKLAALASRGRSLREASVASFVADTE